MRSRTRNTHEVCETSKMWRCMVLDKKDKYCLEYFHDTLFHFHTHVCLGDNYKGKYSWNNYMDRKTVVSTYLRFIDDMLCFKVRVPVCELYILRITGISEEGKILLQTGTYFNFEELTEVFIHRCVWHCSMLPEKALRNINFKHLLFDFVLPNVMNI